MVMTGLEPEVEKSDFNSQNQFLWMPCNEFKCQLFQQLWHKTFLFILQNDVVSWKRRINVSCLLYIFLLILHLFFCLVSIWSGAWLATDLRHVANNRLLLSRQNWFKHSMSILAAAKIDVWIRSVRSRPSDRIKRNSGFSYQKGSFNY